MSLTPALSRRARETHDAAKPAINPLPLGEGRVRAMTDINRVHKLPLPETILVNCRKLRGTQTKPEQMLWACLRSRQLFGVKFRRQHPIGKYIVDFFCMEYKLAIELDGWTHDYRPSYDADRQKYIENQGFSVVRFANQDVLDGLEDVLMTIASYLPSEVVGTV